MSTVPLPAGVVSAMALSDRTVKSASTPPTVTSLAPRKWLPLMTTTLPPAALPEEGLTALTAGALAAL
jgi:hypothetical protein